MAPLSAASVGLDYFAMDPSGTERVLSNTAGLDPDEAFKCFKLRMESGKKNQISRNNLG